MTARTATATSALATWKALAGGDSLTLTGDFPAMLVLADKAFDPPVTVEASTATFAALNIQRVTGLIWTGGMLRPSLGRPGLTISGTKSSTFSGLHYQGDGRLNAIELRDCADVTISRSVIERPRVGITLYMVTRGQVVANSIWGWNGDGIGLQATTDCLVEGNALANPVLLDVGLHPDGIQGYWGAIPNINLTIRGNSVHGRSTQGVFVSANAAFPSPRGTVIEGNFVASSDAPNGVALDDPEGVVRNNRVRTLPGSKWQTTVYTTGGARRSGNVVEAYAPWKALAD